MLNFFKEMLEYYCWENYSILEFLTIITTEVLLVGFLLGELIVGIKNTWNEEYQFEDYDFEEELEEDQFIFDASIYENYDILTPLSQQEKP